MTTEGGQREIVALQNTLVTPGAPTPDVVKELTDVHPCKGERAPGFCARKLLSFGESKKPIPRFARDDKTKAFVSLFPKLDRLRGPK
jgi:hypothetical protein